MAKSAHPGSTGHFGTGRIVFWRGGSAWIGDVREATGLHAHHAIQVTLALSGTQVHVRSSAAGVVSGPAVIVPAHEAHALEAPGQRVALVFTEPESLEGRRLRAPGKSGLYAPDPALLGDAAVRLAAAYQEGAPDEELAAHARALGARLASCQRGAAPLDPRIERALGIVQARLGDAVTMTEVAAAVHLSPERFRHLFLQETGMRFRPYVLWLRLETAVAAYGRGASLTQAAHGAGFADSAHLSRTFKRMFGVQAIGVRRAAAHD